MATSRIGSSAPGCLSNPAGQALRPRRGRRRRATRCRHESLLAAAHGAGHDRMIRWSFGVTALHPHSEHNIPNIGLHRFSRPAGSTDQAHRYDHGRVHRPHSNGDLVRISDAALYLISVANYQEIPNACAAGSCRADRPWPISSLFHCRRST